MNNGPYSASKAGLNHFAKCVAREEASKGIRVNVVSPGAVMTEMLASGFGQEPTEEKYVDVFLTSLSCLTMHSDNYFIFSMAMMRIAMKDYQPIGRVGEVEDLANDMYYWYYGAKALSLLEGKVHH